MVLFIISTFRLCGVFLFTERRSIPSKYIALCPLIAFILATTPASAGRFGFNVCGRYCWFKLLPTQRTCRVKSLWAWFCYYGWMILFLAILFGSTMFVMVKIATAVTASQKDLRRVTNQPLNYVTTEDPPIQPPSAIERIQSTGNIATLASLGLDLPTLNGDSTETTATSYNIQQQTQDVPQPVSEVAPNIAESNPTGSIAILRAKERPFFVAILRQSLYPIAISVSGCLQIIADLTIYDWDDYDNVFGYVANVATSIQGFLFFLVFMFDPAVMQTRQHWKKYCIWKYYIEFYYSLGMPQEGRDFKTRFMDKCEGLDQYGNEATFDQLTKPPPYSWTLQDNHLVMPDFQTVYPLVNVTSNTTQNMDTFSNTQPHSHVASSSSEQRVSPGLLFGRKNEDVVGDDVRDTLPNTNQEERKSYVDKAPPRDADADNPPVVPIGVERTSSNSNNTNNRTPGVGTDYTNSFQHLSPDTPLPPTNPDKEDPKMYSIVEIGIPAQGNTSASPTPHVKIAPKANIAPQTEEVGCSQLVSIPKSAKQRSYSSDSNDSYLLDDDFDFDTDLRRASTSHRKVVVSAPRPGDVLAFPRLKKSTTIGGSDLVSEQATKSVPRRATTTSIGCKVNIRGASTGLSSLGCWFKRLFWPGHEDEGSVLRHYQNEFKHPRWAYLMHLVVRQVYIPRKARLPPIPNPFKQRQGSNSINQEGAYQQAIRPGILSPQAPAFTQ
ncbi:hypothetical protein BGX27_001736 [Mortierella sp. AM989]|nr:hypothetical protein BGX27_001736 [Mortierella sp. AM989]